MLGLAWMLRSSPHLRGSRLLIAGVWVASVSLVMDFLLRSYVWSSLFVRRFLIIPGALTVGYVSVFHDRPKTNFAEVLPGVESPYAAPSFIVGAEFTGDPTTNANVNLWGNGYLAYGYIGMALISLVFILVLWIADAVSEGLPIRVVILIWFKMTIVLSSASLFTAASTHGLAAGLILLAVLPRDGWGRADEGSYGGVDPRKTGRTGGLPSSNSKVMEPDPVTRTPDL